jgi:hypothetical protein
VNVSGFIHLLLSQPRYGLVAVAIVGEIVVVQVQIIWLLVQAGRLRRQDKQGARFAQELAGSVLDVLRDEAARAEWVRRARTYPRTIVRRQLEPLLTLTAGEARDGVVGLYRTLGLLAEDIRMSRSVLWNRRVRAIRRLALVASPAEAPVLLERHSDRHLIKVVAAQTLVRVGTPEQLLAFLGRLTIPNRLMEQPLAEVLGTATVEQMDTMLDGLPLITDPGVRRLVLVAGAHISPGSCLRYLFEAAVDDDKEVRIGACIAAATIAVSDLLPLMLAALRDPAFEVRAQAAKALARMRMEAAIDPLTAALEDRAFWVRQNAAAALRAFGDPGRRRLEEVAANGRDRFAADTARQELRRHQLLATARDLAS